MYGMVLMVAVTGSGDAASFGKHKGGCTGDAVVVSGCTGDVVGCSGSGCSGSHHFLGGRGGIFGGGGIFGKHKHSCDGGCSSAPAAGCTGTVVVAPTGCTGAVAAPACEKERKGLFSRLCKKKDKGCDTCAVPACDPCATPATTGTTGTTTTQTPDHMPPVTGGLTAEESKWFDEMVKAGAYKETDKDAWKAATPKERKDAYEAFKKEHEVPALTADEIKWFDEMVKAGAYKATDKDAWAKATPKERKEAYEAFKKDAKKPE